MSFFNIFKKKTPKGLKDPKINVRVWINQEAKEKACTKMALADPALIFIAWSKVTWDHFQEAFKAQGLPNEVLLANDIIPSRMTGKNFVFLERHYDHDKEDKLLNSLKTNQVLVHVSLNDPLMAVFSGDRLLEMMNKMGVKEDEFIEHPMINKSIERAMEKIKNSDIRGDDYGELTNWIEGIT